MNMKWKLLLAFSAMQYVASACSCVEVSQKYARAVAYAIFDGTVTDIRYFDNEKDREISSRVLVTFKIAKSWKGPAGSSIQVHVMERALICDSYKFELGRRYVVYAIQQDKESGWADQYPAGTQILATGGCTLRIRENANAESRRLGKPRVNSN